MSKIIFLTERFVENEDFLNLFISSLNNYHRVPHKAHSNPTGRERKQSPPFLTLDCGDYRKTESKGRESRYSNMCLKPLLSEPEWWRRAWTLNRNAWAMLSCFSVS